MVVMHTRGSSKLSSTERKELILDLCRALSTLNSSKEVAEALTDLLTPKEVETIAKRLKIAEYLVEGKDYREIREMLKVGYSTIARVNTWINLSGAGFKVMLERKKKYHSPKKKVSLEERYDPYSWHNIKKRYSLYFWPQLILEELLDQASKKEKKKMEKIFEKIDLKKRRFTSRKNKELYELFSQQFEDNKLPNRHKKPSA